MSAQTYLVLDRRNFRKPMAVLDHDGDARCPGVLFFSLDGKSGAGPVPATAFVTADEAEQAIRRSLTWAAARGYDWTPEDYEVIGAARYLDELAEARRPRRRRRTAAPEDGTV